MAKKAKKRVTKKTPLRRQRSRVERERRLHRMLVWGVIVVAVLVVGVVGYGLVYEKVIKARQPVAEVGGVPITTAEFQARTRYEQMQLEWELAYYRTQQRSLNPNDPESEALLQQINSAISGLEFELSVVENTAYETLIREELVRQGAVSRGLFVTPEELQQKIESSFGFDRNPATPVPTELPIATPVLTATEELTPTATAIPLPTPTAMTEEAFRQEYNDYLRETLRPIGVSERQFRSWFEADLLANKLREEMEREQPPRADQVQVRYLTVVTDTVALANELVARLDGGEDFQALADELEADEQITSYSWELPWYTRDVLERTLDVLGPGLAELAFSLEVGAHSQPVLSEDGTRYTIIQVMGHEERDLDDATRQQMANQAFLDWLEAQDERVVRYLFNEPEPEDTPQE